MIDLENLRVLDLETTGFGSKSEVLEISLIDGHGDAIIHTLCQPLKNVEWPDAQAVNGIAPEDVIGSSYPVFAEVLPRIIEMCRGKTLVIYNKGFDMRYCGGLEAVTKETLCCMLRFAKYYGKRRKLEEAANVTGFDWSGLKAHSALSDTLAALHVWKYLDDKEASHA